MILSIRVKNFLVYSKEVKLSLRANMKIKRMVSNTIHNENINILKSAGIYGANNVGKTCLVRAIQSIKNVLLGIGAEVGVNLYSNDPVCSFGITFTNNKRIYDYEYKFNSYNASFSRGFVYEKFSEVKIDKHGNETNKIIFLKDAEKQNYLFPDDKNVEELMKSVAINNILIYTINTEKYELLNDIKNILIDCAKSIEIIYSNNIPLQKTIACLKDDNFEKSKIVDLIKYADLDVQDYQYVKPDIINSPVHDNNIPHEIVLMAQNSADIYCLMSNHRGRKVPSISYDSTGTKKIVALAGYIVEALEKGKTLVVDELDSSLHFKLTRAIAALFNNELNTKAQLIFTVHDITLLDCKKLFRKDQIWFASKQDNGTAILCSLDEYTAHDGVRADSSDIADLYRKGFLGNLPDPDFISVLMERDNDKAR